MSNVDIKYYIIKTLDKYGKPYENYEKCLCTKGFQKCKYVKGGGFGSIWSANEEITAGEGFPANRWGSSDKAKDILSDSKTGLYSTLKFMNVDGKDVVVDLGRDESLVCLNPDFNNDIRNVIETKDSNVLFFKKFAEPISTVAPIPSAKMVAPSKIPMVKIKPLRIAHEVGTYWYAVIGEEAPLEKLFEKKLEKETDTMWKTTVKEGLETQTALCLNGDTISVLKDDEGNTSFIKGNEQSVKAFSRDLVCPTDSVKVGTLHTHPPLAQEKLSEMEALTDMDVELTNEQSLADLELMVNSDSIMTCTRSKQSITCFVNTTRVDARELLKDVLERPIIFKDKQRFKGELMDRGIQKFKNPFVGIDTTQSIQCVETVGERMDCMSMPLAYVSGARKSNIQNLEQSISGKLKNNPSDVVSSKKSGMHVTNVELIDRGVSDFDGKQKRFLEVIPFTTPEVFCWKGIGGKVWCDGIRPLTNVKIHKDLLAPRFERQVWDTMYENLDQDYTASPLWVVLENYMKLLDISREDEDIKKRNRFKGIMDDYINRKDNNEFVRRVLPLIRLE